jgi:predicted N-acetyltransferase YhbS
MSDQLEVLYIPDTSVDQHLDGELRNLLTICFTKPQDTVFRHRRYLLEPPQHRWVIRDGLHRVVAHAAVHEKEVISAQQSYKIGGIAEVCVHPDFRQRGFTKALLTAIHEWLARRGFAFAMLFGNPTVYSSSGYWAAPNVCCDIGDESGQIQRKQITPLVRTLSDMAWPLGSVYLPGSPF